MKIIGIYGEAGSNKMIYAFRLIRDLNLLGHRTVWGNFAESLYLELNKIASERVKGDSLGTIVESNDLAVNGSYDAAEALYKMLDPSLIGESNPEYDWEMFSRDAQNQVGEPSLTDILESPYFPYAK